jgi:mRNA interferase MazF
MALTSPAVHRGEIWDVALDPIVGSEQGKTRPCLIVQRDAANAASPVTIVCPLTDASGKAPNLLNVLVAQGEGGVPKASLVLCNQIRTIDCRRLRGQARGSVESRTMALVDEGLRAILDL